MFFDLNPNRPGTLRFQLFGFPIAIHWSFWILTVLLGVGGGSADPVDQTRLLLIFVLVFFVSILGHELGHAFAYRKYGGKPQVFIHGIGGMAVAQGHFTRKQRIVITAAGPFFGLAMGGACYVLNVLGFNLVVGGQYVDAFLGLMILINVFWSLVNLLPIIPLDGGQMLGHIMHERRPVLRGQIGAGCALIAGLFLFSIGFFFGMILFGFLAYQNFQAAERAKRGYR